jgi:hypothetical protein
MKLSAVTPDMGCGEFSGDESNGYYIEVAGPGSEAEVLEAFERLFSPESIERSDHCPPVITFHGGRTVVFVDIAPEPGGPAVLAVGRLDEDAGAGGRAAEEICRTLSSQTPWLLACTTDEGDHLECIDRAS